MYYSPSSPLLIAVTGATASGKTSLAIRLAQHLGCEIVSADSRQIYKGIPIGTAQPTSEELAAAAHHLVGMLPLDSYYSASLFEQQALALLPGIFKRSGGVAVVCGGSMMYVDALCRGIDELPTVSVEVRTRLASLYASEGIGPVAEQLRRLDPEYAGRVDMANHKRVIHALEICLESGKPYSSLLTGQAAERPFRTVRVALDWPREQLFERINRRVDLMMQSGLEEEARGVYHLRHLNSLNTVGYKEMFAMFDGLMERDAAVARIAKNTRVYAKKQLTWLKRPGAAPTRFLRPDLSAQEVLESIAVTG